MGYVHPAPSSSGFACLWALMRFSQSQWSLERGLIKQIMLKSISDNKDFQLCYQPIRSQVWKSLLINIGFSVSQQSRSLKNTEKQTNHIKPQFNSGHRDLTMQSKAKGQAHPVGHIGNCNMLGTLTGAMYQLSRSIWTWIAPCCVLLPLGFRRFHPYPSGLFHYDSPSLSEETMQKIGARVKKKPWYYNHNKTKNHKTVCVCARYAVLLPVTCLARGFSASMCKWWAVVTLIARLLGPTWGQSGADRTQVGPMLAPWTLLSGYVWSTAVIQAWYQGQKLLRASQNMIVSQIIDVPYICKPTSLYS